MREALARMRDYAALTRVRKLSRSTALAACKGSYESMGPGSEFIFSIVSRGITEDGERGYTDRLMAKIYAGTSGWSYSSWKPEFYPANLAPAKFLDFYASRLNSVKGRKTKKF